MDQSPPPRFVISARQRLLVPGIVTVNVITSAIIIPQRIPLRKSLILIPFVHFVIETHLKSDPALLRLISDRVMKTWSLASALGAHAGGSDEIPVHTAPVSRNCTRWPP